MDRAYGWGVLPSIDGYFFYFEVILQIITLFLYELDDRYYKKISATRK